MDVVQKVKLEKTDDGSLVFVILDSELETENDYYLVTVQMPNPSPNVNFITINFKP